MSTPPNGIPVLQGWEEVKAEPTTSRTSSCGAWRRPTTSPVSPP
jgi:hypothetical protein